MYGMRYFSLGTMYAILRIEMRGFDEDNPTHW